jgi:hypothetical protein
LHSTVKIVKSRRLCFAEDVARMGEMNAYRILIWKPLGKCPLGRVRRSWEDNIKMDLKEMGCEGGRWMELAENFVRWQVLILVMLKQWILLPWCCIVALHKNYGE